MWGRSYARPSAGFGKHRHGDFFGLDVEEMSPRTQILASLAVLAPVALSGIVLVAFAPGLWWVFTTYFWAAFPAFGLLRRGIAGAPAENRKRPTEISGEQELLEALREHGELTAAGAAMHTSLSVAEADRMLGELSRGGHLEVRTRGGGLSYALWGAPAIPSSRDLEVGVQGET